MSFELLEKTLYKIEKRGNTEWHKKVKLPEALEIGVILRDKGLKIGYFILNKNSKAIHNVLANTYVKKHGLCPYFERV